MATLWNPNPIPVFNPSTGERAGGALAYFYVGGTTTPLAVFTSDDGTTPLPWPVVADANGVFPPIFIPYGAYGYRVTTSGGTAISPNVLTVQNPAPPDSGGGGGIVVTADQIIQTGDPFWRLRTGTMSGFVRMNSQTIGSVGSGATERANDDTEPLYIFLWNTFPDAIAPVSGGRGTTAAADFAANKTITIPTMQGYIAGGLDDMGGTTANRIQRSTTISTTNSSPTATVASISGIVIGMYVVSANVPAGTTITAISGTTLTLSGNASATASGTAARFSMFPDAQAVGSAGGNAQHNILERQLPAITPAGSVSVSVTNSSTPIDRNRTSGTGAPAENGHWYGSFGSPEAMNASASFTGTTFGGSQAMPLIPPTRLGTWYLKL